MRNDLSTMQRTGMVGWVSRCPSGRWQWRIAVAGKIVESGTCETRREAEASRDVRIRERHAVRDLSKGYIDKSHGRIPGKASRAPLAPEAGPVQDVEPGVGW